MLTKIKAMCLILVLIMLTGLVTAYYHARAHESLLFAIPRISGTNVSAQFLRQASDMGMIVTYENRQATTISVLGNSHNVVLVSTNHDLPFVMGHHIVHGRFFSEYAFKYGHRVAVLNKQAAFALFGSVESTGNEIIMNNIPYIVVGVINDADRDGLNIYVPATLLCDTATAIATNPNMSPTLSKMGILSQWQHMGIDGHNYIFVDFEVLQTVIRDKTILVIAIFLITAMVFILLKTISAVKKQVKDLGFLARNFYLRQVILKPPTWKLTGLLLVALSLVAGCAAIVMDAFMRGLLANNTRAMLTNIQTAAFSRQIADMAKWYNLSNLFFLGFVVIFVLLILLNCKGDTV